jgi:Spy/CpxP family protein refolding chaperone
MKRRIALLATIAALAACSGDSTAPDDLFLDLDESAILVWDAAGVSLPGRYLAGLHRLPAELRLSDAQVAGIREAVGRFHDTSKADHEALAAIMREARAAHQAGKSAEEVRQILARGDAIRQRIEQAEAALHAAISAILTAGQKAWLEAHLPKRCDPHAAPQLTDAQRTQIRALLAVFEEANRADLEAVKSALERAREASRKGASRQEIATILNSVRAARVRLIAARTELHRAIDAVLTPEQRASGCYGKPGR